MTSEPVPAVVGTAMNGDGRVGERLSAADDFQVIERVAGVGEHAPRSPCPRRWRCRRRSPRRRRSLRTRARSAPERMSSTVGSPANRRSGTPSMRVAAGRAPVTTSARRPMRSGGGRDVAEGALREDDAGSGRELEGHAYQP